VSRLRRMAEEAMSTVDRKLIEVEERERAWIARELHDDFSQRMAIVSSSRCFPIPKLRLVGTS